MNMKEYLEYLLNEKNFEYDEALNLYCLELNNNSYNIKINKNKVRMIIYYYDNEYIEDEYFIDVKELNKFLMKHLSKIFRKEKIEKFLK